MKKTFLLFLIGGYLCAMKPDSKIYIAGHHGLVGSAIIRRLTAEGFNNIVVRSSKELDLRNQLAVEEFFAKEKPEYVFLAAAKVGGIKANNDCPAEFIYDNLAISLNVIHASYKYGVKKLLFLGSSCIYPKMSVLPIREGYLLTGPLEKTNEAYALAKIAGLKMCQFYNRQYGTHFISCMPTNLYGINDNFDLEKSHVIPALIAKVCAAKKEDKKEVVVWGNGTAWREFLFVDDLADALVFLMQNYDGNEHVNIGTGQDVTILDLVTMIKDIVGYKGEVVFDQTKPNGTPRKLLDVEFLNKLGWKAKTSLQEGLEKTIKWYQEVALI